MTSSSALIKKIEENFARYKKISPKERVALAKRELYLLPRQGWVREGIPHPETVGDHTDSVVRHIEKEAPAGIDISKAKEMALIHDLPEAIVTDITPYDPITKERKRALERETLLLLFEDSDEKEKALSLFSEYLEELTPESLFVHDVDTLDPLFVALHYEAKYPEKKGLFEKFATRAERAIRTEKGREILERVKLGW